MTRGAHRRAPGGRGALAARAGASRGRIARDLALGARLTLSGGRAGLLRTAITAIGVALGVAVLLIAASIPAIHDGRQARGEARGDAAGTPVGAAPGSRPAAGGVLVADAD